MEVFIIGDMMYTLATVTFNPVFHCILYGEHSCSPYTCWPLEGISCKITNSHLGVRAHTRSHTHTSLTSCLFYRAEYKRQRTESSTTCPCSLSVTTWTSILFQSSSSHIAILYDINRVHDTLNLVCTNPNNTGSNLPCGVRTVPSNQSIHTQT